MLGIEVPHYLLPESIVPDVNNVCGCCVLCAVCLQLQSRTDKGKRKKGDDGGRNEKRQRTAKRNYD